MILADIPIHDVGHIGEEPHILDIEEKSGSQRKNRKNDENDKDDDTAFFSGLFGLAGHRAPLLKIVLHIV
jgi:hypothetical protein